MEGLKYPKGNTNEKEAIAEKNHRRNGKGEASLEEGDLAARKVKDIVRGSRAAAVAELKPALSRRERFDGMGKETFG